MTDFVVPPTEGACMVRHIAAAGAVCLNAWLLIAACRPTNVQVTMRGAAPLAALLLAALLCTAARGELPGFVQFANEGHMYLAFLNNTNQTLVFNATIKHVHNDTSGVWQVGFDFNSTFMQVWQLFASNGGTPCMWTGAWVPDSDPNSQTGIRVVNDTVWQSSHDIVSSSYNDTTGVFEVNVWLFVYGVDPARFTASTTAFAAINNGNYSSTRCSYADWALDRGFWDMPALREVANYTVANTSATCVNGVADVNASLGCVSCIEGWFDTDCSATVPPTPAPTPVPTTTAAPTTALPNRTATRSITQSLATTPAPTTPNTTAAPNTTTAGPSTTAAPTIPFDQTRIITCTIEGSLATFSFREFVTLVEQVMALEAGRVIHVSSVGGSVITRFYFAEIRNAPETQEMLTTRFIGTVAFGQNALTARYVILNATEQVQQFTTAAPATVTAAPEPGIAPDGSRTVTIAIIVIILVVIVVIAVIVAVYYWVQKGKKKNKKGGRYEAQNDDTELRPAGATQQQQSPQQQQPRAAQPAPAPRAKDGQGFDSLGGDAQVAPVHERASPQRTALPAPAPAPRQDMEPSPRDDDAAAYTPRDDSIQPESPQVY